MSWYALSRFPCYRVSWFSWAGQNHGWHAGPDRWIKIGTSVPCLLPQDDHSSTVHDLLSVSQKFQDPQRMVLGVWGRTVEHWFWADFLAAVPQRKDVDFSTFRILMEIFFMSLSNCHVPKCLGGELLPMDRKRKARCWEWNLEEFHGESLDDVNNHLIVI